MARPLGIEYERAVYHVTSRGNGRERIYENGDHNETGLRFPRPTLHNRQSPRKRTRGENMIIQDPKALVDANVRFHYIVSSLFRYYFQECRLP